MAGTIQDRETHYKPRCRTCKTTWGGILAAHCGACHETFTSLAAFDLHRLSDRCATIRENGGGNAAELIRADGKPLPLMRRSDNKWRFPGREYYGPIVRLDGEDEE